MGRGQFEVLKVKEIETFVSVNASFLTIPMTILLGIWPVNMASRSTELAPLDTVKCLVTTCVKGYLAPVLDMIFSNRSCPQRLISPVWSLVKCPQWPPGIYFRRWRIVLGDRIPDRCDTLWIWRWCCWEGASPACTYPHVTDPWLQCSCCSLSSNSFGRWPCSNPHRTPHDHPSRSIQDIPEMSSWTPPR